MLDLTVVLEALPPVQTGGSNATFTNATRVLGVGSARLHRWERDGLSVPEAEDVAAALHRHPTELWEDWYQALNDHVDAELAAHGVQCAAEGCDERFIPAPRWPARYCSPECKREARKQRRRVTHQATVCEADGCTVTFTPKITVGPTRHRFCSGRCENRMTMRTYRATERGREVNRLARRKYELEVRAIKARRAQQKVA